MKKNPLFFLLIISICLLMGGRVSTTAAQDIKAESPTGEPIAPTAIGGPDAFGYIYYDSAEPECTTTFTDISGSGTALGLSDDGEANVSMPFSFDFYGTSSTNVRVGDNGGLLFGVTTGDLSGNNTSLPTIGPAPLRILPFWDDLDNANGNVYYATLGSAPNRRFIVQWHNRPHYSNIGTATFQAILYEGSNDIDFVYNDTDFGNVLYNDGASATIGITQNGANALQYSFNTASLTGITAICFFHPAPSSPEPTNHPTAFSATADSSSQITSSWTDSVGINLPSGYLLLCNLTGTFSDPVDGIVQSDDTNCADGSGVKNMAHGSGSSYAWTGLNSGTQYYYKIFPYSNSWTDIDYKTDGIPATANATTLAPLAAPQVTTHTQGSDLILSWLPISGAVEYHVYQRTTPYFTLDLPFDTVTEPEFTHVGALADTSAYFYIVTAVASVGQETLSQPVGKFTFTLSTN